MLHLSHLLLHVVHLLLELVASVLPEVLVLGRLSEDAGTFLVKLHLLLLQLLLAAQMERRQLLNEAAVLADSSMPLGPAERMSLHSQPMGLAINLTQTRCGKAT